MQPCFGCLKEALQAGISTIKYLNSWEHPDRRLKRTYDMLQKFFPEGVFKIDFDNK
jgi:dCMP deaminase